MGDKYRGKKSKGLHDQLGWWHHFEECGTWYNDATSEYEWLKGSYIYFDADLSGIKQLIKHGFNIQEKKTTWLDVSASKKISDRDNQPYFEYRVYIGDKKNNPGLLASFTLDFFEIELPERDLKKLFHGKNEYVEFFTDKIEDINNLLKKGYKIQRAKVAWMPISLKGKNKKN
jgi:hypothetical protein